ncbi:hypothetical protein CH371_13865 [Leptospira wolffii]|uniref:GH29D-like beta-sandwich domain-containing protein n=1 Tax=Leptospira wolffii TaxID=409998 RepID=A0A2M9ZAV1_9LEPT|nr:chitobiase/beta-hexosaminidase C-terminal domain-containing protein [Leptospira wolffii]PJZ65467.1 hypothetical protein CH371_13865 [Leptospira wolffii]
MLNNVSLLFTPLLILQLIFLTNCGKSQDDPLWILLLLSPKDVTVIPPENPNFSPSGGGSYTGGQSITLTSNTGGADIYYTKNGQDPETSGTLYSSPISCYYPAFTLKAVSKKDGQFSQITSSGFNCNLCTMNSQCPGYVCSGGLCQ